MAITLEVLRDSLGKKKGNLVSQETVDELNRLESDGDYGEEFTDAYKQYFNVLEKNSAWSTPKYMHALKFFSLMEADHSAVDAYVKTFPERLEARHERGESKRDMGGEASRYNASGLVNEIRRVAGISVKLTHRHTMLKAIQVTTDLMLDRNVSPAVRQKAAETLIRELRPEEDSNVVIKVGMTDDMKNQQAKLVDHIGTIALNQQKMLAAGMKIEDIQRLNVSVIRDEEYEEAEEVYDEE
jgi:hypothetical protein